MNRLRLVLMIASIVAVIACEEKVNPPDELADVVTNAASSITSTSAICGGHVNADGGAAVTAKGVCWDTITNPTITDSTTNDGAGTGSFVSHLTDLLPNRTYYVRAYATNSEGTAYGNEINFTTAYQYTIPVINTAFATYITTVSAVSGGNVTDDGGKTVTARGVCWDTSSNPTFSNNKTTDGSGTGSFISTITGLTAGTKYYIRAYATNAVGTAYGNQDSFITASLGSVVTDVDGNVYHTITIGSQIWLLENLKTTHYRNGDPIAHVTDNGTWSTQTTGAYCDYNNDTSLVSTYGRLYNWHTVKDSRGLAPTGWHVPALEDWQTLTGYLGDTTTGGGKIKEIGLEHWVSPNAGATNETGFTALPGGERYSTGEFEEMTHFGLWWSTTQYDTSDAWLLYVTAVTSKVYRYKLDQKNGLSVRCVKD